MPVGVSTARGQKRKRSPKINPTTESTPPPESPWKRVGFRSAEEANTEFWDNLPTVPLCPPALRELDRRNSLAIGPISRSAASTTRPTTRSVARREAQVNELVRQSSTVSDDLAAQLKFFARRGGPDLQNIRGCPEPKEAFPTMPRKKTPYKTPSNSIENTNEAFRRTSAYHPGFEQHLINHGVYPDGYRHVDSRRPPKPDNWEEVQQMITRRRPSLSSSQFSVGAFETYADRVNQALDEADVMANAFPILKGETKLPSAMKKTFQNLKPLTDGTIAYAEPDYYVGARPEQLDPHVRMELNSYVVPSANPRAPILPNNSTEMKGPGGTRAVVRRQACYDGAIGARAMQSLQSYGNPTPVYDNNAYTISSSFDGELLQMYTTHPTAPANPGGQPEYHMNQLRSFAMNDTPETFRQGATAYRNARDWTKEKRNESIEAANERARNLLQDTSFDSSGYSDPSTSINKAAAPESEMSAHELALTYVTVTPRSNKRVKRGQYERDDPVHQPSKCGKRRR